MSAAIEIERLAELHRTGALTDEEFARAKARVLGASAAAPEVGARVRGGCARAAGGNELGADGGMDRARRSGRRWVPLARSDQRAGGRSLGSGVEQPQLPPQREFFFFA
jgi:hypothetical protein